MSTSTAHLQARLHAVVGVALAHAAQHLDGVGGTTVAQVLETAGFEAPFPTFPVMQSVGRQAFVKVSWLFRY